MKPEAYHKLASVWLLRSKPDLAIKAYKSALQVDAGFVPACLELTALLVEKGELISALDICQQTYNQNKNNRLLAARLHEITGLIEGKSDKCETSAVKLHKPSHQAPAVVPVANLNKTVLIYTDCSGMDGAEQCSHIIVMELVRVGYTVVCAQPFAEHELIDSRRRSGIQHVWLEQEDIYSGKSASESNAAVQEAERLFDRLQPDLIFFSDGSPFSSLLAKKVANAHGIPYLILTHCVNKEWRDLYSDRLADLCVAFEGAREVVAVSQSNLDSLRALFQLPGDKGRVIYNGRPNVFFADRDQMVREQIRAELGISNEKIICVTVARMEVMKGYQYLLRVIEGLMGTSVWDKVEFVWVGTGTLENRLRARAAETGVDSKIHFLGAGRDVAAILDAADIFILPSQYEGMPLSVIEAMAKGLPVIASRVSGIPEAIADTGVLISDPREHPETAIREIIETIQQWVKEPSKGRLFGSKGRMRARKLFTTERMLNDYIELIGSCLLEDRSVCPRVNAIK